MGLESKLSPNLEEFVRKHHLNDEEKKTLERYWNYSDKLGKEIANFYELQNSAHKFITWLEPDQKGRHKLKISLRKMHPNLDTPNPATRIFPFFEKNYALIASLPPELGRRVILPTIVYSHYDNPLTDDDKSLEAQGILEDILAFLADDSKLPTKGRESIVNFLGETAAGIINNFGSGNLDDDGYKLAITCTMLNGFSREDIHTFIETYNNWYNLLKTDKIFIGSELLLKLANEWKLPVLCESGAIFFQKGKENELYRHHDFEPLQQVAQVYKSHFNLQSKVRLPEEVIITYLFHNILESKDYGQLFSLRTNAEKAFEYLGRLQKNLEGMKLQFPVSDLVQTVISSLKEQKYDLLENMFNVISRNQCQSLEEVVECSHLNLKLEDSGYQVIHRMAAGTFKKVYLAKDKFGIECVLKEIIDERVISVLKGKVTPQEMEKKELKSSPFQMQHPHINPIMPLYIKDSKDSVYLLEPKYEQTMEKLVHDLHQGNVFGKDPQGKGTILLYPYSEKVIRLMYQLASALEYCHERDIIHGDFKLDNVGIKHEGAGEEYALLSDFGLATSDKHLAGEKEFTYNLGRVYTKHPDLFRGGGHSDKSTDAFAFGAELFYLCTGRYPFSDEEQIPDYSKQEEKIKYLRKVHSLVRESGNRWAEVLSANIKKYFPVGIVVAHHYPIVNNIIRPYREEVDYALAKQFYHLNGSSFMSGLFMFGPHFSLLNLRSNPFTDVKKYLEDMLKKIDQHE